MDDICKRIFDQSPHPSICHRAIIGEDGTPVTFEYEISNQAYDRFFGRSGKEASYLNLIPGHADEKFDWFSFRALLWEQKKEPRTEVYFPSADCFMQVESYRIGDNMVVTWFNQLEYDTAKKRSFRTERQLSMLFDNMPGVAVQGYDIDRKVTFWNRSSEILYGYSAGEVMGKDILDLIIPGEMHLEVTALIDEMIRTGKGKTPDFLYLKHKDGHLCPVLTHYAVIEYPPGNKQLYCIDIDMSPYEKIEEEVRKLSRAVEQSPVSIVITDPEGNIEYVNPVFCQLTGYDREEVISDN
ncbi:MAG: PAS domain S-box protein, partial [Marinilabilia sp.]